LILQALDVLAILPWHGKMKGMPNQDPLHTLHRFLIPDMWLSDIQIDQILELLRADLQREGSDDVIESRDFLGKVVEAYERRETGEYDESRYFKRIHSLGCAMASGDVTRVGCIMHLDVEKHWVAVVIDGEKHSILYGDSFRKEMPEHVKQALTWWTEYHHRINFNHGEMPVTYQVDSFSCGLLSTNALAVLMSPWRYDVIEQSDVNAARLKLFLRLTDIHFNQVSC
ncbi:hypothetical protein BDZ89DRAFT_897692, partial [Hymenopellis radicata]